MPNIQAVKLPSASGALGAIGVPGGTFAGWSMHATGGAAIVRFWDNASAASGTILAVVELTASGDDASDTEVLNHALFVTKGVWVEYVSGTVEGSVYVG